VQFHLYAEVVDGGKKYQVDLFKTPVVVEPLKTPAAGK
jgi:hypothetical protein